MRLPNEFELKEGTLEELNSIITQPGFKGVIKNLPEDFYHLSKGLSRSRVVEAKSNISNFLDCLESERVVSPAMEFGTDVHCAILEPEKFQANYAAEPLKEDFEELLISSDDLKGELEKHVDLVPLEKALEEKRTELATFEKEKAPKEIANVENMIAKMTKDIESQDWPTKKEMNAKIKDGTAPLKDSIKILKDEHKKTVATIKEDIKALTADLSLKKKLFTSTKATLIKEIRKYNKDVPIWDEIITTFRRESEGKRLISQNNMRKLVKIMNNAQKRNSLKALLKSGYPELTIFWTDEETGLLLKARFDFFAITPNMVLPIDFKTCPNAETMAFLNSVAKRDYHFQAAMYLEGANMVFEPLTRGRAKKFLFIPVENEKACEINNVSLGEASLEKGYKDFRTALNSIAHYYKSLEEGKGVYTGYPQEIQEGEIPIYALA